MRGRGLGRWCKDFERCIRPVRRLTDLAKTAARALSCRIKQRRHSSPQMLSVFPDISES